MDAHAGATTQADLLERERELASLAALIDAAAGGTARVALVEGRAGIGKTQLIAETRRRAADARLRVLAARGGELEREFAFGVVRQLFEPHLVEAESRQRLLSAAAGPARPVFEPLQDGPGGDAVGDTSFAVLHGLFWLTVNFSGDGPLLLAVDDLHWCDRPSLRFLAYLVRRLEGLPVLLVCSLRPSEPGVDLALLGEIAGDPLTTSLHPGPLSEAAVAELVQRRLGEHADQTFSGACHVATGGNPLLLNELLKALETEGVRPDVTQVAVVADLGPRAASRAVLLRLARLSPEAVVAARAIAVLGDGADRVTVAALAGLDERQAAVATEALARAEIIRAEPPLGFVHPLVAGAVYHDITASERELQHERAARLLSELGAPGEHVAAQLLTIPGRGDPWVVETLRAAAAAALQKGAPDSAASYLARALEEPPPADVRTELLLELGRAELLTNGPAAAEHLQEAYEGLRHPAARGATAQLLGRALLFTGSAHEGAEVARRAAAELPPELSDLRQALEAFELVAVFFGAGDPEALRRLERHRSVGRGAGVGEKMLAALASLEWTYSGGSAEACAALALDALAGGDLVAADPNLLAISTTNVLVLADRDEVLDVWDASLAQAHRHGSLFAISGIHMWHGFTLLRRGELAEAEEELRTAFEEFEVWGYGPTARLYCSGFLAAALLERGKLEEARHALARGGDADFVADGVRFWLVNRLELLVAEGRAEEAIETADRIAREYPHVVNPAVGPWRSLKAQALDRLGRHEEALALAREELELARRFGAPWGLGRSLRVLGTLEREEGLGYLREGVEVLAASPARLEDAKALAALGSALRRSRQPTEAREPLRHALELAEACGAEGLVDHVRSELYATGARPRTTALRGVESLTASERRVAALAAEGQSNRDIAQALFVTPKTVEVHLSNAYRKLGIRSRRELASALAVG